MVSTKTLRAVLAGAGNAMMGQPTVVNAVLELTGKAASEVNLLYIGTATYDLEQFRLQQTEGYVQRGVHVETLNVACRTPTVHEVDKAIDEADVILVSGGCTLFAVDRWHKANMVAALQRAMDRGATLCGGSAGAGCWFDALHSDSMDPDWYRDTMLAGRGAAASKDPTAAEASRGDASGSRREQPRSWEYIRVPALGFLPGLVCPHHDRTQSNGVLRSADFADMLRRHPGETGLAIDHYAALVLCDGEYRVLALPEMPGSLAPDGSNQPGRGVPACWLKQVDPDGHTIHEHALSARGPLDDLLHPATSVCEDPRVDVARRENPAHDL